MGSIIGHRIDYNGVGALRGQRHIPSKNSRKYSPGFFPVRSFCYRVLSFLLSTPIICKLGVTWAFIFQSGCDVSVLCF